MPLSKPPLDLKTEISKLAKRSNIQNGLPPAMRGLPVLAILAGEAISKVTKGPNTVEERMLGSDETFLLKGPNEKEPVTMPEGKGESEGMTTKRETGEKGKE